MHLGRQGESLKYSTCINSKHREVKVLIVVVKYRCVKIHKKLKRRQYFQFLKHENEGCENFSVKIFTLKLSECFGENAA